MYKLRDRAIFQVIIVKVTDMLMGMLVTMPAVLKEFLIGHLVKAVLQTMLGKPVMVPTCMDHSRCRVARREILIKLMEELLGTPQARPPALTKERIGLLQLQAIWPVQASLHQTRAPHMEECKVWQVCKGWQGCKGWHHKWRHRRWHRHQ